MTTVRTFTVTLTESDETYSAEAFAVDAPGLPYETEQDTARDAALEALDGALTILGYDDDDR